MKKILLALFFVSLMSCTRNNEYAPEKIIWNEISTSEAASMPFGNGIVGANVWVENGGLYLYLARNDSFSELARLLKIGKIKLSVDSCLWNSNFSQSLDLNDGMIEICNDCVKLKIFADSEQPIIWIKGTLNEPKKVKVEPQIWRTAPYMPSEGNERVSCWGLRDAPGDLPFAESADTILNLPDYAAFCHHNDTSIFEMTLKNNRLSDIGVKDPIIGRTFGAMIQGDNLSTFSNGVLESKNPISEFIVKIAATSVEECSVDKWAEQTCSQLEQSGTYQSAEQRTRQHWNDVWERSYLKISTPDDTTGKQITQLYNCQRWITLSAGRSKYPIKFNGSIFTVAAGKANKDMDFNPDFRRWGECFWWQNTRLPYFSMLKTGDWETIRCLGRFYKSLMPAFKKQAEVYYNAKGAIIPETITQFGTFAISDYGRNTNSLEPTNMCIRHIFQDPLELIHMLMDYYRYSDDEKYLTEVIVPMAEEFLDFYISHNKIDSLGKLRMCNTQALETYWYEVENDMPTVAGLHAVVNDFSEIEPSRALSEKILYLKDILPPLPIRYDSSGVALFAPAEKYVNIHTNVENPELMAIFPFELCNFTKDNAQIGRDSYSARYYKQTEGWNQDGQLAALLGMTEEARDQLLIRIKNGNPNFKFPAYFGPNFDWVPDQDHGGNLMTHIQDMVIQSHDGNVYLLPAFPKDWDVQFKFAVPGNTTVSGDYSSEKWVTKPVDIVQ